MAYKTTVQTIKRPRGPMQHYVNFPMALAKLIDLQPKEEVEWVLTQDGKIVLLRPNAPQQISVNIEGGVKKNARKL